MNQAAKESASAELTPMFLLNAAMCIEAPHDVGTSAKREILAKLHRIAAQMQDDRMAARRATPRAESADYSELRRKARAASKEGWKIGTFGQLGVQDAKFMLADNDAAYIAVANPATILAMIDRLEELEGAKMQLKGELK